MLAIFFFFLVKLGRFQEMLLIYFLAVAESGLLSSSAINDCYNIHNKFEIGREAAF